MYTQTDQLTVREALPIFYKNYNLEPDGGLSDYAVKVEYFKGFFIYFPNVEARKKVILTHDIHHLLTGYKAVMSGETEISSWELSTGCRHNWFAFMINTLGMMTGVLINLKGIWKAWLRGKCSKNLYKAKYRTEELLNKKVADLRQELGLIKEPTPKNIFSVVTSFMGFLVFGGFISILSIVLIPLILIYTVVVAIKKL